MAFDRNELSVQASGDANLGILQGFYRDLRSRGTAAIKAQITGPLDKPVFAGSADITDGRIRVLSVPNSIEAINGRISFDAGGVRLDDVAAQLGEGDVRFGGRIGITGFTLGDLNLTATGERMRIRYPRGLRLDHRRQPRRCRGTVAPPLLSGNVLVRDALLVAAHRGHARPLQPHRRQQQRRPRRRGAGAVRCSRSGSTSTSMRRRPCGSRTTSPRWSRAPISKLQGTYDRPQLFGHVEIDRGDIVFEGNRYVHHPRRHRLLQRGADRAGVRHRGRNAGPRARPDLQRHARLQRHDQPLLLHAELRSAAAGSRRHRRCCSGRRTDLDNAELRALRPNAAQQSEEVLLRQAFSRLLTNPISAPVSRILGETLGIETVIAPTFGTESDPLTPSARLILGRRLSNRAYLTFARALGGTQREQIIILEYDQNDRVGWVVTQNGDRTFALDFRVRHRF